MRTRASRLAAVVLVTLASGAAQLVGPAGRAWAVQTATWGIVAAPNGPGRDYRPEISYPASGRRVTDSVIVWNRTNSPLTVRLSVLSVSRSAGTYQYSTQLTGLAAAVHIPVDQVVLGPYQQATVPVTIDEPSRLTQAETAAVAGESRPVHDGALSVQEQLAVLIKSTPTADVVTTGHQSSGPSGAVLFFGTIGGAFIALVLFLLDRERRRKDEDLAAEAAGQFAITAEFLSQLPPPTGEPLVLSGSTGEEIPD